MVNSSFLFTVSSLHLLSQRRFDLAKRLYSRPSAWGKKMRVTVAVITLNEEKNIEACIKSATWADEIVLLDSGSSDRTVELAKRYTSKIFLHPFRDFADQKNEALKHCTGDWVFFIDADERIPSLLAAEIQEVTRSLHETAYQVKRQTVLFGKELKYSGTQHDFQIRLFPKGKAHFEQPVHEKVITMLPVNQLRHSLLHYSTADMGEYKVKLNQYISFEVALIQQTGRKISACDILLRPPAKFISLYVLKLGFLDGIAGFKVAALAAYYDFMKFFKGSKMLYTSPP